MKTNMENRLTVRRSKEKQCGFIYIQVGRFVITIYLVGCSALNHEMQ